MPTWYYHNRKGCRVTIADAASPSFASKWRLQSSEQGDKTNVRLHFPWKRRILGRWHVSMSTDARSAGLARSSQEWQRSKTPARGRAIWRDSWRMGRGGAWQPSLSGSRTTSISPMSGAYVLARSACSETRATLRRVNYSIPCLCARRSRPASYGRRSRTQSA